MEAAILLHEGVSAVEVLGSFAVLGRVPSLRVQLVAARPGVCPMQGPPLTLTASTTTGAVASADVLVLPGGLGAPYLADDAALVDWVRRVHDASEWTVATSNGDVLLDAAGVARTGDHVLRGTDAVELTLTVAGDVAGITVADRIRAEVAAGDVRRWYEEAVAATTAPSRWQRLVGRARHGSIVVEHDDSRAGPLPPQVPKGWRGPAPMPGSAVEE